MIKFSDISRIHSSCHQELNEVFQTGLSKGDFINGGYLKSFEKSFAAYLGVKYVIGCANGTDALEISLLSLGIGPGDEVIVPNHTWISTASAVVRIGATPVFVDTSDKNYLILPEQIVAAISTKTKAIIPVHLYGLPCEMARINEIAKEYGLFVIEDAAQAHGASINNKKCGSFGDLACFSFYPSKNLGALGDGGCIATNSEALMLSIKSFINCGQKEKNKHNLIGRNSRLDTLQAGILNVKLKYLDKWNLQRIEAAAYYNEAFLNSDFVLPNTPSNKVHVFHIYAIQTNRREQIIKRLEKENIQYGYHYPNFLADLNVFKLNSRSIAKSDYSQKLLSLPIFPGIKKEELDLVVKNCLNL